MNACERNRLEVRAALASACLAMSAFAAWAQDKAPAGDLATAQELSNPLSSLISVPLQNDFGFGGAEGATSYQGNLQPVVPFKLNDDLTLIARTIVPFVDDGNGHGGIGDTSESLFFSPSTRNGFTYGAGPIFLIPTASEKALGPRQFGLGPTAVALEKQGPVLFGVLVNQVWGVTGPSRGGQRLSQAFIQPFFSYTFPTKTTLVANVESSYDWQAHQWTVPVDIFVNQLLTVGRQKIQLGLGPRYFITAPPGSQRWGLRFNITLVFPTAGAG